MTTECLKAKEKANIKREIYPHKRASVGLPDQRPEKGYYVALKVLMH